MLRNICLFIILLMGSLYAVAQPAAMDSTKAPADTVRIMTSNPEARSQAQAGPVLAAEELRRAKWFYSMSEAMREPEKVYKLSLSRKKLKRMPTDIIMRFPNLQVLNLSQNKIKEIPDEIIRLKNLQTLILHHNKLRKLPADMREMGELQELYLGYNKFIQVPAWVGGLGKLRRLDITSNQLTLYEIELVQKRLPRCEVTH